jgi:hypothetical protein
MSKMGKTTHPTHAKRIQQLKLHMPARDKALLRALDVHHKLCLVLVALLQLCDGALSARLHMGECRMTSLPMHPTYSQWASHNPL